MIKLKTASAHAFTSSISINLQLKYFVSGKEFGHGNPVLASFSREQWGEFVVSRREFLNFYHLVIASFMLTSSAGRDNSS